MIACVNCSKVVSPQGPRFSRRTGKKKLVLGWSFGIRRAAMAKIKKKGRLSSHIGRH